MVCDGKITLLCGEVHRINQKSIGTDKFNGRSMTFACGTTDGTFNTRLCFFSLLCKRVDLIKSRLVFVAEEVADRSSTALREVRGQATHHSK